jgi:uncharacterized membrane protein
MSTGRLEGFSDGVIAVAITLLVLGLSVPPPPLAHTPGAHTLAYQLGQQWPAYLAYVISFLTIGIIWINHHASISRLRSVNHAVLTLNLLLLMSICVLPFTTRLTATYLTASSGENLAAGIYSGSLLLMGSCFSLLNWYTLEARAELLEGSISDAERHLLLRRAVSGVIPYAVAVALAIISPYASLAVCGAVGVFYAFPAANTIRS